MYVKISNKIKWTKIDLGCRHVTAVLPMSWNSLVAKAPGDFKFKMVLEIHVASV